MITENYLDEDVAYLLGLIVMRGQLYDRGAERGITIEFPFKSLEVEGYDQAVYLQLSVNRIRDRIQELVESHVRVDQVGETFVFSIRFLQNPVTWRNLRYLLGKHHSYKEFQIPTSVMEAPYEVQKQFLRGVADVGGFIRDSNRQSRQTHLLHPYLTRRDEQSIDTLASSSPTLRRARVYWRYSIKNRHMGSDTQNA